MRCASFIKQGRGQNTSKQVRHGLDTARNKGKSTIQGQETRQNKLNSDLENTKWLSKAANSWRVLNAGPDSELDMNTEGSVRQLKLDECYMQNNTRR